MNLVQRTHDFLAVLDDSNFHVSSPSLATLAFLQM